MVNTFRVFCLIIGVLGLLAGCVTPIDYGKCQGYSSEAVRYQCEQDERNRIQQSNDKVSSGISRMFNAHADARRDRNSRTCTSRTDYNGNVTTDCQDN